MTSLTRRVFFTRSAWALGGLSAARGAAAEAAPVPARRSRLGVSTYSFFQFRHEAFRPVERCIERAAELGFDGVEILRRQVGEPSAQQMREFQGEVAAEFAEFEL